MALQIPDILHHLSTDRVITMEFVEGAGVCDRDALQRMGIKPSDVAKLVSETFNEMIFTFGDVSPLSPSCPPCAAAIQHCPGGLPVLETIMLLRSVAPADRINFLEDSM